MGVRALSPTTGGVVNGPFGLALPTASGFDYRGSITVPTASVVTTAPMWVQSRTTRVNCGQGFFGGCDFFQSDSAPFTIPPYTAAATPTPSGGTPAGGGPSAILFAHNSPAGANTLIDARESTGSGLSFAFSPSQCTNATAVGGGVLPTGIARVTDGYNGNCTVTVTNATGGRSTATVAITSDLSTPNTGFSFTAGTATLSVDIAPIGLHHACVDPTGGTNHNRLVMFAQSGLFGLAGNIALGDIIPGRHAISATLWPAGTQASCTGGPGTPIQTIRDLYAGNGTETVTTSSAKGQQAMESGARAQQANQYAARSSLRLAPTKTISLGKVDSSGAMIGGVIRGRFTWTVARGGAASARPAALATLRRGDYVMRATQMNFGPPVAGGTSLIGSATVLLRGAATTMQCGVITGGVDGSTISLTGGSGAGGRMTGTVTGAPITYRIPTFAPTTKMTKKAMAARKRAAMKIKATSNTGTARLMQTTTGTAMPADCHALVGYLK